jgi:hypothetical protein
VGCPFAFLAVPQKKNQGCPLAKILNHPCDDQDGIPPARLMSNHVEPYTQTLPLRAA